MATRFDTLYAELASRLNDAAHALWTLDRKKAFVNGAVQRWNELGGGREVIDETTLADASSVEYLLPPGIPSAASVIDVTVEQGTGEPYARITDKRPRLVDSGGDLPAAATRVKLLLEEPFDTAGKKVRVRYQAPHPAMSNAADVTEIPTEFLYLYACYLAHREAAGRPSLADRKFHLEQAAAALRDLAELGFHLPRSEPRENIPSDW